MTRRIDDLSTEMLTLKTEMHQTHRKVLGRLEWGSGSDCGVWLFIYSTLSTEH